jgi:hypothetical protein
MLKNNPFEPITSKKSNPFEPISDSKPSVAPSSEVISSAPAATSSVKKYGLTTPFDNPLAKAASSIPRTVSAPVEKKTPLLDLAKKSAVSTAKRILFPALPNKEVLDMVDKKFKVSESAINLLNHPAVQPVLKEVSKRTSGTGIYSAIQAAGPKTFEEAYKANKEAQAGDTSKLNQFLYQLGDTLPQTAIGVALNFVPYAGKPLSTTYWTALSANEQIENKGKVTSLTNIGIDVALDSVLGKSIEAIFKAPAKTLLSTIKKNFTVEGGTEVAQDLLKMGNDYRSAKTPEERQAILKNAKDYFTSGQILMTAGVGGLSGAGVGAGAHFLNKAQEGGQNIEERDVSGEETSPARLYHGTDSATLEKIKSEGFKSGSEGYVSLTDDPKVAQQFAEGAARASGGLPVVVEVNPNSTKIIRNFDPNDLESIRTQEREYIVRPEDEKNLVILDTPERTNQLMKSYDNNEIDPTKSIEELDAQYRATKPGYKNFSEYVDRMVKNQTILPEEATVLRTIFEGTNDELLGGIKFSDNARLSSTLGRFRYHKNRLGVVPGSQEIQMKKGLSTSGRSQASRVFVHEFGHAGWHLVLSPEERAVVSKVFRSMPLETRKSLFTDNSNNADYYAKSEQEFFAQSFSDYVMENKVPAPQMESILKRVAGELYRRIRNLVTRKQTPAVEVMKPLFEKILAGDKSTPLQEFYNKETPSFKQELQQMVERLAPEVSAQQKPLFTPPATKEAPVEAQKPKPLEPQTTFNAPISSVSPMGAAEEILQKGTEGLPPDIASTIEPLEAVVDSQKNTPLSERIRKIDYLRTPWKVFERMKIRPVYQTLLKAYDGYVHELPQNIDKITAWSKMVSKEGNEKIFNFLDGKEVSLTPVESQVAKEVKTWLGQWADRLGMSPDSRISDYITHIFPKGIGGEMPEEIAILINKKIPGQTYNPFLLERQGAKGYIPDTWRALDAYVKRATRKVHMDPALAELKEASSRLTDVSQVNYLTKYVEAINMRPSESDTEWDNQIKSIFGGFFGPRPTARITRGLRMMISRAKIGGSITSFAKNLTQGVNTFGELGTQYTLRGYIDLAKFGAKELNENGVLAAPFIEDRTYSAVKKNIERIDKVLFANMNASELVNRGAAYYGAKAKFAAGRVTPKEFRKALGRERPANYTPTMEDAVAYGKFIAAKTQFLFGALNTPVGLSSDTAKLVFQFQTFGLKQVEFIIGMVEDRELAKLLRYMISSILLFSTIASAFGMKWTDSVWPLRWGYPPAIQFFIDLYTGGVAGTDKYGNKLNLDQRAKAAGKTLFTNVVPGGAQMMRSSEALSVLDSGKEVTRGGKFKYRVAPTTENYIAGTLFGKYNLPESKDYYKKEEQKKKGVKTKSGGNPFEPL